MEIAAAASPQSIDKLLVGLAPVAAAAHSSAEAAVAAVAGLGNGGGVNDYGAQRLRKKARQAKASGADPTDYDISPTARSFVPFYAQRLSSDCVLHGARGIQQSIKRMTQRRSGATSK